MSTTIHSVGCLGNGLSGSNNNNTYNSNNNNSSYITIVAMLHEITPVGQCCTSSFRINLHRHAALTWWVIEMHPAVQDGPKLQREVAVNLLHFMVQELVEPDQVGRIGSIWQ